MCDLCSEENNEDPNKTAKWHCIQCGEKLCAQCCIHHKRVKATKSHELIEIGSESNEHLLKNRPSFCDQHLGKPLELYCNDCKMVMCVTCLVDEHNTHSFDDIYRVSKEFGTSLLNEISKVIERRELWKEHAKTLEAEKLKFNKRIEIQQEEIRRQLAMFDSFIKFSQEVVDKAATSDMCRVGNDLQIRARELETLTLAPLPIVGFAPKEKTSFVNADSQTYPSSIDLSTTTKSRTPQSGLQNMHYSTYFYFSIYFYFIFTLLLLLQFFSWRCTEYSIDICLTE